jgi:hypothetical protein
MVRRGRWPLVTASPWVKKSLAGCSMIRSRWVVTHRTLTAALDTIGGGLGRIWAELGDGIIEQTCNFAPTGKDCLLAHSPHSVVE